MLVKLDEQITICNMFHKGGMFPALKSPEAIFTIVQAGAELGYAPFEALNSMHLISGKPVLSSGAIAARVKGSGKYDYRVIACTDAICKVEFFESGKSLGVLEYTADQAKKEGVKNMDKMPQDMLFARAISKGTRRFCPDVFKTSVYAEGEITEDIQHEVVSTQALPDLSELRKEIWDLAEGKKSVANEKQLAFIGRVQSSEVHSWDFEKIEKAKSFLNGIS